MLKIPRLKIPKNKTITYYNNNEIMHIKKKNDFFKLESSKAESALFNLKGCDLWNFRLLISTTKL